MTLREEWLSRYQNQKTRKQAEIVLRIYDQFILLKYQGNEELLLEKCRSDIEANKYFVLDELVQFWTSLEFTTSTMRNYFTFVRDYLRKNGIQTLPATVKDYVKFPKDVQEEKYPLTKELIKTILDVCNPEYQVLILCLVSSGMRIGELLNCRISWLDFSLYKSNGNIRVMIPGIFTKGMRDRYTFFSKQASKLLVPYVKNRTVDGPVFTIDYNAAEKYMEWIREKIGFTEKYNSGFYKISIHSFRSYADTVLTDMVNEQFKKLVLGHKMKLRYYTKSPLEALQKYEKAEKELTIELENTIPN